MIIIDLPAAAAKGPRRPSAHLKIGILWDGHHHIPPPFSAASQSISTKLDTNDNSTKLPQH